MGEPHESGSETEPAFSEFYDFVHYIRVALGLNKTKLIRAM